MATNGIGKATAARTELRVSVRVDAPLMRKIAKIAKLNGISASDVVRMALNQQLPENGGKAA